MTSQPRRPRLLRAVILAVALTLGTLLVLPAPPARADGTPTERVVDSFVATQPTGRLAGAVVTDRGVETFARGGADVHTRFRIASMSKAFTAAVAMRLVERGRLDLDAPVTDVLTDFALADGRAGEITLRMLLSHTSGLTEESYAELNIPVPADGSELLQRLRQARLAVEPGTKHEYLNTNYGLAALMIERVTGQPFADALRTEVLAPLGMADTLTVTNCTEPVAGVGSGHGVVLGRPVPLPEPSARCLGDGGMTSTAADMTRWLRFQLDAGVASEGTRVLSEASMLQTWTAQPGTATGSRGGYGLGWGVGARDGGTLGTDGVIGHSGALATWASDVRLLSTDGRASTAGVVVLSDTAGNPGQLTTALVAGMTGETAPAFNPARGWMADVVILGLALLTLILGALGVLRSDRWADQRRRSPGARARARSITGLTWPLLLALFGLFLPPLAGLVLGVRLNWLGSWAYALPILPTLTGLAVVLIVVGLLVTVRRGRAILRNG